ncbi:hypothetical protein [Streptomyces sp. LN245]|uniref:hypothetical protein n=1 Tax=Streptomyces sp. LN245 TaxID=3112975 RepID=UPI0037229185
MALAWVSRSARSTSWSWRSPSGIHGAGVVTRVPPGLCFAVSGAAAMAAALVRARNARTPRPDAGAGHCAGGVARPAEADGARLPA